MSSESADGGLKDEAEVRARLAAMEVRRDELIRLCLALPGGIGDAVLRDQLEELEKQMVPLQEALAKSDPHRQPEREGTSHRSAPDDRGEMRSMARKRLLGWLLLLLIEAILFILAFVWVQPPLLWLLLATCVLVSIPIVGRIVALRKQLRADGDDDAGTG